MSLAEQDDVVSPEAARTVAAGAELQGLAARAMNHVLSCLEFGTLTMVLPDGGRAHYAAAGAGPDATLVLHRWRTVWRTLRRGDMGFAESFIDGDCSSPDIAKVVELFVRNEAMLARMTGFKALQLFTKLFHVTRANTRKGARRNISAHYDLGNAFFEHWLDAGMTYSSALYEGATVELEAAQTAKQARVLRELAAPPGADVLEIGCGWGGLAERLLDSGCRVTGLTLSPAQLAYARARLAQEVADGRADLRLQDYREVAGSFDRIVSIEMMEAVGLAYWPSYFATIRDRLARDGRAVLQVITLDESRYEGYRTQVDFIQRYIFPGGMLPTPTIMREQVAAAGMKLVRTFSFGDSYARTLAEWSRRFSAALPQVEAVGYDARFQRLWTYYLAYCEGGFRAGILDVGLYTIEHA